MSADGFVSYPPRWHNVLLPRRPVRAMLTGMTLYGPSRARAVALQRGLYASALVTRGRFVPGSRAAEWASPIDVAAWRRLVVEWRDLVGADIDGIAIHRRVQSQRNGFTALICAGPRSIVARVSRSSASVDLEQRVAQSATQQHVQSFSVPRTRGSGEVDGWFWRASEAISHRPHRPARQMPDRLTGEIAAVVEQVRPRTPDIPAHWVAAHRDLSPWNLRRASGRLWLIDWEDCGWAPPEADRVYFAATRAAVAERARLPLQWTDGQLEAVRYWIEQVAHREAAPMEVRLRERTLAALGEAGALA